MMTRCGEERRKMAAEWAQLHAAEKTRQEQEERRAGRHLERDAHAHSNIISIAQVGKGGERERERERVSPNNGTSEADEYIQFKQTLS